MKLVLQRAVGDCGIAALATLLEHSYEDVYLASAATDAHYRGKSGLTISKMFQIGQRLGVTLRRRRQADYDAAGLLIVRMRQTRPFGFHMVALDHGVIADPADGLVLPPDEYFTREEAVAGSFLELC